MGLGRRLCVWVVFSSRQVKVMVATLSSPFPQLQTAGTLLCGAGHAKGKLARVEDVQRDIVCCASVFGTRM